MKVRVFFVLLSTFLFSSFARVGIGASAGYNFSTKPDSCAAISIRSDLNPWNVFICAHFSENLDTFQNKVSVITDDWFVNESLLKNLDFYVFWGISASALYESDSDKTSIEITTGSRFGAGLDLWLCHRRIDLFLQAVWNPYAGISHKDSLKPLFVPVNFPVTSGIRIYF